MFKTYKVVEGSGEPDLRAELNNHVTTAERTTLGQIKLTWGCGYELEYNGRTTPLTYEGFDYLMYRLNMPMWYMARCQPAMVIPHADHWANGSTKEVDVLTVNGLAMAVVTMKFAKVPNSKIVDSLASVPGLTTERWTLSPKSMAVHAGGDSRTAENVREVRAGDEVVIGLRVTNSETGWGQLTCSGIIFRASTPQSWATLPPEFGEFAKRHQGDPDKLWVNFNETWTALTAGFGKVAARLEEMAKIAVSSPEVEGIVDEIIRQLKLPAKAKELLSTGVQTVYEVWDRLVALGSNPDYASHADDIRRAAGEWIVVPGSKNPLWVTL